MWGWNRKDEGLTPLHCQLLLLKLLEKDHIGLIIIMTKKVGPIVSIPSVGSLGAPSWFWITDTGMILRYTILLATLCKSLQKNHRGPSCSFLLFSMSAPCSVSLRGASSCKWTRAISSHSIFYGILLLLCPLPPRASPPPKKRPPPSTLFIFTHLFFSLSLSLHWSTLLSEQRVQPSTCYSICILHVCSRLIFHKHKKFREITGGNISKVQNKLTVQNGCVLSGKWLPIVIVIKIHLNRLK